MKTYNIITYGCQMNRADSERIASLFVSMGLTAIERADDADVIVVNACSVRQTAIDRIWGSLERFETIKQQRPLVMILTGCVLPSDKPKFQSRFDAVIPIKEIQKLPEILSSLSATYPKRVVGESFLNQPQLKQNPSPSPSNASQKGFGVDEFSYSSLFEQGFDREWSKGSVSRAIETVPAKRDASLTKENSSHQNLHTKPFNYFTNQPLTPISQNVVSNTYLNLRPKHASRYSAFVPIMTGCNAFCTYCAVPYTRGAEENRKPEEIIQEVEDLVMNKGYKEITLLGQIINKYNVRADDAFIKYLEWFEAKHAITLSFLPELQTSEKRIFKFHHLLETLGKLPNKYWLRFTSSHPNWFTDELIATIRDIPNIPKHFHLPVQSGSDSVLLRMRRPYKISQYLEFINKIREQIPLATITTDCIVGFCGETEEEFQESLRVFEAARYDMAFLGQYSPRPDTQAIKLMKDDVPKEVKMEREQRLNEVLKQTSFENNQRLVGTTWGVLIHEQKNTGVYSGTSENFKHVHVESDSPRFAGEAGRELPIGEFASVRITEANPWSLKGMVLSL